MAVDHPPQLNPGPTAVLVEPHQDLLRHTGFERDGLTDRPTATLVAPVIGDQRTVEIQLGAVVGLCHESDVAGTRGRDVPVVADDEVLVHVEQRLLVEVVEDLRLHKSAHDWTTRDVGQGRGGVVPVVVVDGDKDAWLRFGVCR